MITKSYNRGAILRAAWSQARWVAEVVGEPVRQFIGDAMRQCWALAKGVAYTAATAATAAPAMVPQPVQQAQANAGAVGPAPVQQADAVDRVELDKREKALSAEFDRQVLKCEVLREIQRDASKVYWECRDKSNPAAPRRSKAEVHAKHVLDEMSGRCDAASDTLNTLMGGLKEIWRLQGHKDVQPVMVSQPVQQPQARDLRGPPEPREIRVTALGHQGHPCDPESPEASLWIVTDDRLSRDCASLKEAIDLAEDFRGWGYVVPAN